METAMDNAVRSIKQCITQSGDGRDSLDKIIEILEASSGYWDHIDDCGKHSILKTILRHLCYINISSSPEPEPENGILKPDDLRAEPELFRIHTEFVAIPYTPSNILFKLNKRRIKGRSQEEAVDIRSSEKYDVDIITIEDTFHVLGNFPTDDDEKIKSLLYAKEVFFFRIRKFFPFHRIGTWSCREAHSDGAASKARRDCELNRLLKCATNETDREFLLFHIKVRFSKEQDRAKKWNIARTFFLLADYFKSHGGLNGFDEQNGCGGMCLYLVENCHLYDLELCTPLLSSRFWVFASENMGPKFWKALLQALSRNDIFYQIDTFMNRAIASNMISCVVSIHDCGASNLFQHLRKQWTDHQLQYLDLSNYVKASLGRLVQYARESVKKTSSNNSLPADVNDCFLVHLFEEFLPYIPINGYEHQLELFIDNWKQLVQRYSNSISNKEEEEENQMIRDFLQDIDQRIAEIISSRRMYAKRA